MAIDIKHFGSSISNLLSVDCESVTESVTRFTNIFFLTTTALNYVNKVFFASHEIDVFTLNVLPHLNKNSGSVIKYRQTPQLGLLRIDLVISVILAFH